MLKTADSTFYKVTDGNPNMLVPWYLMASYLYYWCDESLLSDPVFDKLCADLLKYFDFIEHQHLHLVSEHDLPSGTCALPLDKYPNRIKCAATRALKKLCGVQAAEKQSAEDLLGDLL